MPGLRAPSNYAEEPPRHPALKINSKCAGNRRTAMSKVQKVRGVGWDISAIGNATWGGAELSDVLELVGIPKFSSVSSLGGTHVEFVRVNRCKEEKGGPYKASIFNSTEAGNIS